MLGENLCNQDSLQGAGGVWTSPGSFPTMKIMIRVSTDGTDDDNEAHVDTAFLAEGCDADQIVNQYNVH